MKSLAYLIGLLILVVALGSLLVVRPVLEIEGFETVPDVVEDLGGASLADAYNPMAQSLVDTQPVVIQNVEPAPAEPTVERVPLFDVKSTKKGIHLFGMVDRDTALEIVEKATAIPERTETAVTPVIKPVGEIEAPGDDPAADNAFAALVTGTQPERCSTRKITQMEQMIREDQNTLQVIYNRIFGAGATPEDPIDKTPAAHRPPVQAGVVLPKTNLFRSIRNTNVEDLEGCIAPADLKNYIRKDQIPCQGCTLD